MAKKSKKKRTGRSGPTRSEAIDMYWDLYLALRDAYWTANDPANRDQLTALADAATEIVRGLEVADIKSRTDEFNRLKAISTRLTKRLENLKKQIDDVVNGIENAAKVVTAIEKIIVKAAKFFL